MTDTKCHLCGSVKSRPLVRLEPIPGHDRLDYFFCLDCGCVYQGEPPSDEVLDKYYRNKGIKSEKQITKLSESKIIVNGWRAEWIMKNAHGDISPKKMVDLGCGEGSLVKIFADMGWDAAGIELSNDMVDFARQRHGAKVLQEMYGEKTFPEHSIGLFTMNQVLEHLKEPAGILKAMRSHLVQDGYLYVDVPTYLLHKKNELAPLVMASTHLRLFTLDNLCRFLENNGFDIVDKIPEMEFVDEHPWVGALARPSELREIVFVNGRNLTAVRIAVLRSRLRASFRAFIRPFKDAVKKVLKAAKIV